MVQNRGEQESVKGRNSMNLKSMRIDVLHFEWGDTQGWIFKIQQYFNIHLFKFSVIFFNIHLFKF